jgi:hypothetical protein
MQDDYRALQEVAAGVNAARRLAIALWEKHYRHTGFDRDRSLDNSLAGVISQIDNMVAGLVKPVKPVPVPERKEQVYQIIRARACPASIAEKMTDEIFAALLGEKPPEKIETRDTTLGRSEMVEIARQILYRRMPLYIHADHCREIAREIVHAFWDAAGEKMMDDKLNSGRNQDSLAGAYRAAGVSSAETSKDVATIAGRLVQITADDIERAANHQGPWGPSGLASDIRSVAASALRQHEQAKPQDFLGRLVIERDELKARLEKLGGFIGNEHITSTGFAGLPKVQRDLLRIQHIHMAGYLLTLETRLSLLRDLQDAAPGDEMTVEQKGVNDIPEVSGKEFQRDG